MIKNLAWVSGVVSLMLAGCATQQDRITASGSFEYVKASERTHIKIPDDLDAPEFTDDYKIPQNDEFHSEELVGRKLEIASPSLVIPLVNGSHIEEGSKGATVLIDQINDKEPLDKTIWNSLIGYLEERNVSVAYFSPEQGVLRTDWMQINEGEDQEGWFESFSWFSEKELPSKGQYEFVLKLKPHGRTAELKTQLLAFEKGERSLEQRNSLQQRRDEVVVLNRVIGHYEYLNQLENNRRIAMIRQGLRMEMGFDDDGNAAFVVDAKYDIAWPRVLLVLRKLGFNVKDLDKSNGLIFAQYTDEQINWWNDLFTSNDAKLLDYEDYRLKVTNLGSKTSITFMDNTSEPFDAKMVADLFAPFEEVMTEDGLDI